MDVVATLAVVVSVLALAYQGRELAKHTRVANEVAGVETHRELMRHWKSITDAFIEHPELRAQYYSNAASRPSPTDTVRLETIASSTRTGLRMASSPVASSVHTGASSWATSSRTPLPVWPHRPLSARVSAHTPVRTRRLMRCLRSTTPLTRQVPDPAGITTRLRHPRRTDSPSIPT